MILGDKHGACKLCLSKGKPLCESHIVPEFCYEYEHSDSGRFAFAIHLPKGGPSEKSSIQKGYREYLLCQACEQLLCKYERVFAAYWRSRDELVGPLKPKQHIVLRGANYHAVKLFILSVFWRASVSEMFGTGMQLGPYAEKLRTILLNNQQVRQDQYPVLGTLILNSDGFPLAGFVDSPVCIRLDQVHGYIMAFAGCEWKIIMSDHWVPNVFKSIQHAIGENGEINLIAMHDFDIRSWRQLAQDQRGKV